MTRLTMTAAAALIALGTTQATAQADNGLYEPAPDPDASFVRLIAPEEEFGTIDTKAMNQMQDVTPYVSVQPGEVRVKAGGTDTTVTVEKGAYYTVALGAGNTATTLKDTIIASPAKADLAFYNLTDTEGLALFVPAAKANVAEGVAVGDMSAVALKAPLTLDFEVRMGDEVIATVPAVELRRKEGISIVVTGSAGAYEAFATNNVFLY